MPNTINNNSEAGLMAAGAAALRPVRRINNPAFPGQHGRRAVATGDGLYLDEFGFRGPAHLLG